MLQRAAGHRLEDSLTLQRDYASLLAREVLAALPRGTFLDGWDGVLAAESAQAAYFSVWYHRHLVPALAGWVLGDQDAVSSIDSLVVPELLLRPEAGGLVAVTLDAALRRRPHSSAPNRRAGAGATCTGRAWNIRCCTWPKGPWETPCACRRMGVAGVDRR